ncbi:hypothetical protein [Taibaiella koreensis]|uniref:hypothetical protein n=1 Tax=Taibaiella koreensis TaxID=1268548 RepID=UPI0013C35D81|nr:hypothetical protein [Taibaiella koreensis]
MPGNDKKSNMKEQVSRLLEQAISTRLAQGPLFRFDGSSEDTQERVVYFDDFIPSTLEALDGLYQQILNDHGDLSLADIDMELLSITRQQLQLP